MALQRPPSGEQSHSFKRAEKHVEEGLEFTKDLLKQFSSGDPAEIPAIHSLTREIRSHVDKLHICQERYLPGISGDPEIDELGTKLWNVCARLKRDFSTPLLSDTTAWAPLDSDGDTNMAGAIPSVPVPVPGVGVFNVIEGAGSITSPGGETTAPTSATINGGGNNSKVKRVKRLIVHGRVLALLLLVIGKKPSPKEQHKSIRACRELIRLMKLVLKAGRDCVELLSSATSTTGSTAAATSKGKGVATKADDSAEEREQDTKLAIMVMEIAANCKGDLQDFTSSPSSSGKHGKAKVGLGEEEVSECNCLEVEYFILRTALSWIDKRLDVAEHMYTKAERLHKFLIPSYAEKLADVLYEIGKSLSGSRDFSMAIKWLERANDVINTQNLEQLSREGVELRLAIFQALVTALLGMDTPQGLERARNLVDYVETELGSTKMIVSLLRLEVLMKTPPEVFDDEAYVVVLRRMIRNVNSTHADASLKLITHHIQKLHKKKGLAACAIMDELIRRVLEQDENHEWLEKLLIQRVWMIQFNLEESAASVETFTGILRVLKRPLSPMALLSTNGLMWMQMKINYQKGQYELAEKWGNAMFYPMFDSLPADNRAKAERKLLSCALARNNMDSALATIKRISSQTWDHEPMTAYLAFKVAIRVKDRDLAERCLGIVSQNKDYIDYLGACIAESQKAEDIESAISGLKRLHEKYEWKSSSGLVNLPALFRCSIRLMNALLENPAHQERKAEIVAELCLEFESVVGAVKQHDYTFNEATIEENGPTNLFTVDELEWFSRNAYNLALKNTSTWDLRCVIRMLNSCVQIIEYFPGDYSREHMVDLSLKMLFSRFIISSALVSLARVQDHIEQQKRDYTEMRRHVAAFDKGLVELLSESLRHATLVAMKMRNRPGVLEQQQQQQETGCLLDQQSKLDMGRKLATLLVFDFEAAIALGEWDDLGGVVAKVKGIDRQAQGEKKANLVVPFQAMADCLLRAAADATGGAGVGVGVEGGGRMNGQVLYSTMRKLVNEIWLLETFDAVKLAKYTRCLFQATLPLDDTLAMNLLEEACRKARELRESNKNCNYWPDEELEWMATTSFNHAIDCYGARDMEKSRLWATKAIELAHHCRDSEQGGGLERAMQKKFASMKFGRGKQHQHWDVIMGGDATGGSGVGSGNKSGGSATLEGSYMT